MKNLILSTLAVMAFTTQGTLAYAKSTDCDCSTQCAAECKDGKGKDCTCKHCDCKKSKKCKKCHDASDSKTEDAEEQKPQS